MAQRSIKKSCNAGTVQPPILGEMDVKCIKKNCCIARGTDAQHNARGQSHLRIAGHGQLFRLISRLSLQPEVCHSPAYSHATCKESDYYRVATKSRTSLCLKLEKYYHKNS